MKSLLDLLPLNIWENISFYCFNEFRVLSKESYNISMIHYPIIMKNIDIKQKLLNKRYIEKIPFIMIKNLINYGIYDIDEFIDEFNNTFIIHSCDNRNIKSVEYLLENNANIYKRNRYGNTPLLRACYYDRNIDIVKYFINKAIDNDNIGNSDLSVIEYINIKNNIGYTPLHYACDYNNIDMVKLLVENGADINIKDEDGDTPLDKAEDNFEISQYLSNINSNLI